MTETENARDWSAEERSDDLLPDEVKKKIAEEAAEEDKRGAGGQDKGDDHGS